MRYKVNIIKSLKEKSWNYLHNCHIHTHPTTHTHTYTKIQIIPGNISNIQKHTYWGKKGQCNR